MKKEAEEEKENVLILAYRELRRLKDQNKILEIKIKKIQQNLLKKINENSLLKDAYDRQKKKIENLETHLRMKEDHDRKKT